MNLNTIPDEKKPLGDMSPAETIRLQFDTCLAVMTEYIDYLRTQSKTKSEMKAYVAPCVDTMVEQYQLGSSFIDHIDLMVHRCFQSRFDKIEDAVDTRVQKEGAFAAIMEDFKKGKILSTFDGNFRRGLM